MLPRLSRKITRYHSRLRITVILLLAAVLALLVFYTPPGNLTIMFFLVLSYILTFLLFNLFISTGLSLAGAGTIVFLLFLKAVGLLNPINLGLFFLFLLLLALYIYKR